MKKNFGFWMIAACVLAAVAVMLCVGIQHSVAKKSLASTPTQGDSYCSGLEDLRLSNEVYTNLCESDFDALVVKQSTYDDLCKIAPPNSLIGFSYGLVCEYPLTNGKYMRITFYGTEKLGPEMTIGKMEVVSKSLKS